MDTFDEFSKELDNEPQVIDETLDTSLHCVLCDWSTHKNSKDKPRGLRNHIRAKHPDEFKEFYPTKKKEVVILPSKIDEAIDDVYAVGKDEDIVKDKLVGDLDLLRTKFPQIPFNWNYTYQSSIPHLKRQKALFTRCLNDEAGTKTIFNLLVISSKAIEKVADVSNMVDLSGYSSDIKENKSEIYPILKNMVDTGVLDVGHLSPELRLVMVMGSIMVTRIETNKATTTNNGFLDMDGVEEPST
jgi:hypothetical protein